MTAAAPPLSRKRLAFASHNWGKDAANHARVRQVVHALRAHGVDVWFDEDHMKGNILNAMSKGVDASDVALVFVTEEYMNKVDSANHHDNVFKEFMYIQSNMETCRIIPVCFEPIRRKWWGPVGMVLGNTLWIDMASDATRVTNVSFLASAIRQQDFKPLKKLQNAIQRVMVNRVFERDGGHEMQDKEAYALAPRAATPGGVRQRVDAISEALDLQGMKMHEIIDRALSTLGMSHAKERAMHDKVQLVERELGIAA